MSVVVPHSPGRLEEVGRSHASGLSFAILGCRGYPSTYGGYETLVRYLVRHLVAEGHHVTVYCRVPKDGQRVWFQDGARCVATRGRDTKQLSTLSFGASSAFDASLRRYDSALILNIANGYWMPMLRAAGVPFAVNTDGLEWKRAKWSRLGRAVFRGGAELSARFAPELIADSQALAAIWAEDFGRTSHFIPYGGEVREPLGDARVRGLGLTPRAYSLSVARLAPENNVELTLDAIEALGPTAPLHVVVGTANFENPITDRIVAMERAGKVRWLGHVADQEMLAEIWQNAGVYVHGHSVGGTNPALLQALGAGAPTIALDTVFNREVLPFEEHLYQPDAASLGARIRQIIDSPSQQSALRETGLEAVSGRYSWDDVCRSYTELLVDLAQTRVAVTA